jgi:pyridoxal phosphate enzyme (YggS family)
MEDESSHIQEYTARIVANLAIVQRRIAAAAERAGRSPAEITLLPVTKTIATELIQIVLRQGLTTFGENRVQEALAKAPELHGAQWELIGTLQRNKARAATALFARIQSVDSVALAQSIDHAAAERGIVMPVLLQVNIAGEATKHGVTPDETLTIARQIALLPHLRGTGLMTIAPQADDPQTVRSVFARLRALRDQIRAEVGDEWRELSMGMTDDFEVAIAEGATIVRVGRALFGERWGSLLEL